MLAEEQSSSPAVVPPDPVSPKVPVLAGKEITKTFGPVKVLENVTLDAFGGEIKAIVGENGAGKSTLMKIFAGLLDPTSGEVRFRGEPVETGTSFDWFAAETNLAGCRIEQTGKNLHQGRFASTILANDCLDLAPKSIQSNVLQDLNRPERFRNFIPGKHRDFGRR